jgi:uncharacterized protein YggE
MDTMNDTNTNPHKKHFFKFLKILVIMLTIFVAVETLNALKQNQYIGRGTPAVNVITVSGKGEVLAQPDTADFTFTISQDGKTAQEAQDAATAKSNAALDAVKTAGVADKDVKTLSYDLSPKYEYNTIVCVAYPCPQGKSTIVGYTVTQTVEVKVRKIDDASALLTQITSAGASDISGISFVVDDPDALTAQAKALAINDAKAKAQTLAKQLGVSLARIVSFSDDADGPIYYAKAYATDASAGGVASAPTPELPTGQNSITSNVTVTYEIQ